MVAKASAGQPLHLSARIWNTLVDMARDYQRRHELGESGQRLQKFRDPTLIWLRNDSGAGKVKGDILEVTDYILTTTLTDEKLYFAGDTQTGNKPCAILIEAIPDGKIGRARVQGPVCVASIDVNDVDNTHVYLDGNLQGNFGGPWRILYKPAGTGSVTAALIMGDACYTRKAVAGEDIAIDSQGDVNVYIDGSNVGTVTAKFNHMTAGGSTITTGTEVLIQWFDDEKFWVIVNAECPA